MLELQERLGLYARQWRLQTIKTNDGKWFSRETIGQMIYDYMARNKDWEPWSAKITGMILEREDAILISIMASRKVMDLNIYRAREVLKEDGYILVNKKDGTQTILQELKADWG